MEFDYSGMDKISLAEKASQKYVKKHVKDGKFSVPMDLALFFRIHELAGQPINSSYGYTEPAVGEEHQKDGGYFKLRPRELVGPYPGLYTIAKKYGIKLKYLEKEAIRKNMFLEMKDSGDDLMEFRIGNGISPVSDYDNILLLQAKVDRNYALFELLKRCEIEKSVEKFGDI